MHAGSVPAEAAIRRPRRHLTRHPLVAVLPLARRHRPTGVPLNPFRRGVSRVRRRALYEPWSAVLGMPTGELTVLDIDEIAAVRVS